MRLIWICMLCAFKNPWYTVRCSVCDKVRTFEVQEEYEELSNTDPKFMQLL